jgi:hypothetical protein
VLRHYLSTRRAGAELSGPPRLFDYCSATDCALFTAAFDAVARRVPVAPAGTSWSLIAAESFGFAELIALTLRVMPVGADIVAFVAVLNRPTRRDSSPKTSDGAVIAVLAAVLAFDPNAAIGFVGFAPR